MPFISKPPHFGPLLFSLGALLSGCQVDPTAALDSVVGPVWVVQTLDGTAFSAAATLRFSPDGRVSGKAPCNRYFGAVEITGSVMTIGPLASTKMACKNLSDDYSYLAALGSMNQLRMDSDRLILTGPTGSEMVFVLQD